MPQKSGRLASDQLSYKFGHWRPSWTVSIVLVFRKYNRLATFGKNELCQLRMMSLCKKKTHQTCSDPLKLSHLAFQTYTTNPLRILTAVATVAVTTAAAAVTAATCLTH